VKRVVELKGPKIETPRRKQWGVSILADENPGVVKAYG